MVSTGSAPTRSKTYGFKPKQNIPESEKGRDWCIENVDWCISMAPIWGKSKVDSWYSLYNGIRTAEQFEHITKTYGIEFPAGKLKHIPLARPLLNRMLSEAEERQFEFVAHTEDDSSIEHKINTVSSQLIMDIIRVIQSSDDPEKEMDKLRRYYQEEYKTEMEIAVQHYLNNYSLRHGLERQLSENMLDKMITGQEFYRVNVNRIGEDPTCEVIKPGNLFYADNNTKWVKDCDWAVHPKLMSPTEILDRFGERMTRDDIRKLEDFQDMYHKDAMYRVSDSSQMDSLLSDASDVRTAYASSEVNHKLVVYFVEWKSIRKVTYIENENKYEPDAPFIKLLSSENLKELGSGKRDKVKIRYIQDRWSGVCINNEIYVDLGKDVYAQRSMSEPSKVYLSFNGLTHNGKIKPYSLIAETEDLQNLYDVLHFHKENLIALSGSRGSYMDLSQIPDFKTGSFEGNLKMFLYYKKMGTAFVDRKKEGADTSFNQFPTFDETLGNGLNAILVMIQHIEDVAGRITGVNRQQLGSTTYADGKATMQTAIQNSAMVTEYMYNEHDEFVEQVLTDIANASRIAHKNGLTGYYTDNKRQQQIFKLDNIMFPYSDLGIHITNRTSDKRSVQELKAMSVALVKEGLMQFEDILPMFKQTGVGEIIRQIEVNMARRKTEMTEQQMQMAQIQQQLQQAREEAEVSKLQKQAEKLAADIAVNQHKLQLEQQSLSDDMTIKQGGLELDKKRVDLEQAQLEIYSKQNAVKSAEVKNN